MCSLLEQIEVSINSLGGGKRYWDKKKIIARTVKKHSKCILEEIDRQVWNSRIQFLVLLFLHLAKEWRVIVGPAKDHKSLCAYHYFLFWESKKEEKSEQ